MCTKAVNRTTSSKIKQTFITYNVEVGWVCSTWVSPDPGRTSSLHMNDGGAQAVDVRLGAVSSTQNQLWTHVHLYKRQVTLH